LLNPLQPDNPIQETRKSLRSGALTGGRRSWFSLNALARPSISRVFAIFLVLGWSAQLAGQTSNPTTKQLNSKQSLVAVAQTTDPALQAAAEKLLERIVAGDAAAADQNWPSPITGRAKRNARRKPTN
jgi:hypothetical protein